MFGILNSENTFDCIKIDKKDGLIHIKSGIEKSK